MDREDFVKICYTFLLQLHSTRIIVFRQNKMEKEKKKEKDGENTPLLSLVCYSTGNILSYLVPVERITLPGEPLPTPSQVKETVRCHSLERVRRKF